MDDHYIINMQDLVFVIPHHSVTSQHTSLLVRCLKSIRYIYRSNKIIVCKTSTSAIEDNSISYLQNS